MAPPGPPMGMGVQKTAKPIAGGILVAIAGILALYQGASIAFLGGGIAAIPGLGGLGLETILYVCGAIFIIFGLIALLGGIMALQRKMWGLALVGSILGLLGLGLLIGSILALIGLILIAISKSEFT